jgi:hypothetical protein
MNLLARARGLQERIRPDKLASSSKAGNVRTVEGCGDGTANAKEVLLVPKRSHCELRGRTGQQVSTREAGRIILNLLHIGEGVPPHSPSPQLN